jgi:hypothetical protein
MPDRFAMAVWVTRPRCATVARCSLNATRRAPPSPRSMARIFCDLAKRVPDIIDCRNDKGRFVCKQYFPEHQHILAQ